MSHEPDLRLAAFASALAVMASWELIAERRHRRHPRGRRWTANFGMAVLGSLAERLLFPIATVGLATVAATREWGVLHQVDLPTGVAVVVAMVVLDFTIYLQHRLFHAVPILWRVHRVHHADEDLDFTSGLRFHPLEIVLSLGIKIVAIVAIGPPPVAVFLFAVLLNASSIFNHSNVRLRGVVDRYLRWVVVTPDMHRVHHSIDLGESNRNFGFNLPWWDRLLGTYQEKPIAGHQKMRLGVERLEGHEPRGLSKLLALPFRRQRVGTDESSPNR